MNCPSCGSTRVRKATAVYEAGTRNSTRRTRGTALGLGFGRRGMGVGLGFYGSRGVGRSSSIAAEKADKARILWFGPKEALGIFIMLSVIFSFCGLENPFGVAFYWAIGLMVGFPLLSGILAVVANKDYDHRWNCGTCGMLWTDDGNSMELGRALGVDEVRTLSDDR